METALLPISSIVFFVLILGLVAGLVRLVPKDESTHGDVSHADGGGGQDKLSSEWGWRGTGARQSARNKTRAA